MLAYQMIGEGGGVGENPYFLHATETPAQSLFIAYSILIPYLKTFF